MHRIDWDIRFRGESFCEMPQRKIADQYDGADVERLAERWQHDAGHLTLCSVEKRITYRGPIGRRATRKRGILPV